MQLGKPLYEKQQYAAKTFVTNQESLITF